MRSQPEPLSGQRERKSKDQTLLTIILSILLIPINSSELRITLRPVKLILPSHKASKPDMLKSFPSNSEAYL